MENILIPALSLLIPIAALMIPIVAILTGHQRKMAEIIHSTQANAAQPEILQLRSEIYELKQLVHQQSIALDNLMSMQRQTVSSENLSERLEVKS